MVIPRNYPFLGLSSPSERHRARSPSPAIVRPLQWALGQIPDRPETSGSKLPSVMTNDRSRNGPSGSKRRTAARRYPSRGISFPTALEESEVHSTRVCLPRYVSLTGFFNLLGIYSSRNLPVLFHTGNAHGIPPSGLFPQHGDGTLSSLVTLMTFSGWVSSQARNGTGRTE
jgi:hypothetical protein